MREIKFRAWDKYAETMSYGKLEQFDDMLGFRFNHFDDESPVYMQFTGLRDKNGREIYEGDICNDLAVFRFVVIWDEDNARFLGRGIGARKEYIRYVGQEPAVIVIGNIYENPELLKGGSAND